MDAEGNGAVMDDPKAGDTDSRARRILIIHNPAAGGLFGRFAVRERALRLL